MIVKNEEALLSRCLDSVKDKVDAIYIADTGSIDNTVEIARRYTPHVFLDFVWCDHMAKAFNHVGSKVPKEYDFILSIDADEILISSREEILEAIELAKDTVRVQMSGEGGKLDFGFPRLFRNTPDIQWTKSIHKTLNVPGEGEPVGNVKIIYGRSPTHDVDVDRSLRILERAVESGEDVSRNTYYLGREYWYKQRYQEAIDTFKRYIQISERLDELADAYLIMAQCYAALLMPKETCEAVLQAVMINPNFKEAVDFVAEISLQENQSQWRRMARYANNEGVMWKRTEVEPVPNVTTIAIFPHNDDESLFMAYTLMRERCLCIIVTDSFIQPERGEFGCSAEIRRQETINAMSIAGCPVVFLGIKDSELRRSELIERLKDFKPDKVYAPAIDRGNSQHDLISEVAQELFGDRVIQYRTYSKSAYFMNVGRVEIKPTEIERETKNRMLDCYLSQLVLPSTQNYFIAVRNKSEWFL